MVNRDHQLAFSLSRLAAHDHPFDMAVQVRALAALPDSPYVLKYYWGWLEPDWKRVGTALSRAPSFPELLAQAQVCWLVFIAQSTCWVPTHPF